MGMNILLDKLNLLDRTVEESMRENNVPGAVFALIKSGKLADQRLYGVSDVTTGAPITAQTYFEAASLTKPVFAYTVFRLADAGVIDLDRPLYTYGVQPPSDDPRVELVTAKHALSHATGMPNWDKHPLSLAFTPGESFSYSGEGYAYLQRTVEHLTGRRLDDLMQEYAFDALGMEGATMIWTPALQRSFATAHDADGKPKPLRKNARHSSGYEPNAAYSLYADVGVYPPFLQCLARNFDPMFAAVQNPAGHGVHWGLGLGFYEELVWHWGDNGGYKSLFLVDRETGDALLMHTNGYNGLEVCFTAFELLTGRDLSDVSAFIASAE